MTTDTSEKGLETLIVRHLTGETGLAVAGSAGGIAGTVPRPEGGGYIAGSPKDFDRAHALDAPQLFAFLKATQFEAFEKPGIAHLGDAADSARMKFLARVSAEVSRRGVIDVLRGGVDHGPLRFELYYGAPSAGNAKAFCRTYGFLSSVLPFGNAGWEKLSIFLNLLVPKLPAPREEDLSKGILEAIDMDSYRAEKKAAQAIALEDKNTEIEPVPTSGGGRKQEPEFDTLSNIIKTFNDEFGTMFADGDRIIKRIRDDIAPKVAADPAFNNARQNTPHTARMAHDQALGKVMQALLRDDTQVYKQFVENPAFKRFVSNMVYSLTAG